jgi:hypothetical protein
LTDILRRLRVFWTIVTIAKNISVALCVAVLAVAFELTRLHMVDVSGRPGKSALMIHSKARSLKRAVSYESLLIDKNIVTGIQQQPPVLASWDDSNVVRKKAPLPVIDPLFRKAFPKEPTKPSLDNVQDDNSQHLDDSQLGLTIRREGNINEFDVELSDSEWDPEDSSSELDDNLDEWSMDERLTHPKKYFRELDRLTEQVLANSMWQFYTVSKWVSS